ncbi:hypothetical protein SAMN04490248_10321 [Salinihabitans flavidus]|uniref:Uncharacterized protein n=1 Tax=Salinihabitans flavidus TaxID=569882 RepID=A0A1H8N5N1_9RHOB|nr:hypothetical protein [Salinihabitans flavidus]SEO24991.1 hypothetical protein SAMN04490248_10321 [Salinihabitans flavidus]
MMDLHTRLMAAHACRDRAALVALYAEAADTVNDPDACGFYLTHAYVHALEAGDNAARTLHARLKAMGRES